MDKRDMLLGYYICKYGKCPEYLKGISDGFLSVSDCLCEHEPRISYTHGWKPNGDKKEYIESLLMNTEQYIKMSSEINELFNRDVFFVDGRFLEHKDAFYFYDTYFRNLDFKLVAVTMDESYFDFVKEDLKVDKDCHISGKYNHIGCDIIGWDISGFHSFLCNSLHENYPNLNFNSYGLVDEKYSTIEIISKEIQEQGEPVDWIPVKIFLYD